MSDQITSSELRSFVTDNTGRRKIDTEASLELHVRAANHLDALSQHVAELRQRLQDTEGTLAQARSAAPAQDPADAAMMLLRNAQTAADETLAEAERIKAAANSTLENAEAHARLEAERHVADAEQQARQIIEAAHAKAQELTAESAKAVDRAEFIQRQYVEKASNVRKEAEALVDFSRQVENLAETEPTVPAELAPAPAADVAPAAEASVLATVADVARPTEAPASVEPASPYAAPEAPAADPVPAAPYANPEQAAEANPAAEEILTDAPAAPPASNSQFLPPPPPPTAAAVDMLDLSEGELDEPIGSDDTIDDELFGDDELEGEVIDLRDSDQAKEDFQFFGREA